MEDMKPGEEIRGERSLTTDPTRLTTAALQREIAGLRETIDARVASLREIIDAKLDGMGRATDLLQRAADRIPSDLDNEIAQIHTLYREKFQSIEKQFHDRDERFFQFKSDSKEAIATALQAAKEAVGAALQAAKEAVGKTEERFSKSIDQLGVQTQTESRALDGKMGEMKDRLEASISAIGARGEASIVALRNELLPQITGERTRGDRGEGRSMGQGAMIAVIFGAISAIGVIVGFVVMLSRMG